MIKRILTSALMVIIPLTIPIKANMLPKIKRHRDQTNEILEQSLDCQEIIKKIETDYNIPTNLLAAVATVESGQKPFAVYARGRSKYFSSHDEAVRFVTEQKKKGVKNLYVGPMQICLKSHGKQFESIEHALTPYNNIRFAAQLLMSLYKKYGTWDKAVMHYNASSRRVSYTNRVMAIWGGDSDYANIKNKTANSDAPKQRHVHVGFGPGIGVHSKKD